jgi:hypothetical protein
VPSATVARELVIAYEANGEEDPVLASPLALVYRSFSLVFRAARELTRELRSVD